MRDIADFDLREPERERETEEGLRKKLKHLSLFPHFAEVNGKDVPLTPSLMDPKIYDGPDKYKISTGRLQDCLKTVMVMEKKKFRHIKVALVDLTKDVMKPEFAASFDHKEQVFAASVPKIAAMLAAFQLRQDIWFLRNKGAKTLAELFDLARRGLADTQNDPGGKPTPFTRNISLRGNLVLLKGGLIKLDGPTVPRLDSVFAAEPAGSVTRIRFRSTGEDKTKLQEIVDGFNEPTKARQELKEAKSKKDAEGIKKATERLAEAEQKFPGFKKRLSDLGFFERMAISAGGDVPASNYATSTIVRDVGFSYIASTLLQSGLYDTNRNGGLWLGADYWSSSWRGALAGGPPQSATAGSLAAFMTLLAQNRLVSPFASAGMGLLLQKLPDPGYPGTGSWFLNGLYNLRNHGSLKKLQAKVGAAGGKDDIAYIEREADAGGGKKMLLRYVAVGLRAKTGSELEQLILELDKCILANNGLTPAQGGHP